MTDIEKRARELLAGEYDADSHAFTARQIRVDPGALGEDFERSIRAIIAALTPPEGYVLVEAAKAADSERLDFLDAMNVALNCHYGTKYGWRLILSDRISRLMSGRQWQGKVGDVDLNDQNAGSSGFSGCREAIDAARPEVRKHVCGPTCGCPPLWTGPAA